jgi:hypothetical protein
MLVLEPEPRHTAGIESTMTYGDSKRGSKIQRSVPILIKFHWCYFPTSIRTKHGDRITSQILDKQSTNSFHGLEK